MGDVEALIRGQPPSSPFAQLGVVSLMGIPSGGWSAAHTMDFDPLPPPPALFQAFPQCPLAAGLQFQRKALLNSALSHLFQRASTGRCLPC